MCVEDVVNERGGLGESGLRWRLGTRAGVQM